MSDLLEMDFKFQYKEGYGEKEALEELDKLLKENKNESNIDLTSICGTYMTISGVDPGKIFIKRLKGTQEYLQVTLLFSGKPEILYVDKPNGTEKK